MVSIHGRISERWSHSADAHHNNLALLLVQKAVTLYLAISAAVTQHTQSPIISFAEEQQLYLLLVFLQMQRTAHVYAYASQAYALITMDTLKSKIHVHTYGPSVLVHTVPFGMM